MLLTSSYYPDSDGTSNEQVIFARGLQNGVVVLLRRLATAGPPEIRDPADYGLENGYRKPLVPSPIAEDGAGSDAL